MIDQAPTATARLLLNQHRTAVRTPRPDGQAARFHRRLPGYKETPLRAAPALAARLGVAHVWLKDESERLELPSFKALGATWAIARLLADRLALPVDDLSLERVREALKRESRPRLVAATDGNHGRAVARTAAQLGLASRILVPAATARARVDAIRGEGAHVQVVDGDYEQAVHVAAALADDDHLVVADTSWPGYEQVPAWIVDGYDTMLDELDRQLETAGAEPPDLVVVPVGVGSLAAAVVSRLRSRPEPDRTRVVTVEPHGAACLMASLRAGRPVTLTGVHDSIMAGLNCNAPSPSVWPLLRDGVDAACSIADHDAVRGIRALTDAGVDAGACAGGAVGALLALLADTHEGNGTALGVDGTSSVVALLTEGPTDAALERKLVESAR